VVETQFLNILYIKFLLQVLSPMAEKISNIYIYIYIYI
jgi:hypothetical protein